MFDVRINAAARFSCRPDWSWDTEHALWEDTDLWLVLAGVGRLQTPERDYPVRRGDCFLLEGGRRYRGSHDPSRPLSVIAVHFDVVDDRRRSPLPAELSREHRRLVDPEFLAQCLERVLLSHAATGQSERRGSSFWLSAALTEIARVDRAEAIERRPPAEVRVRELCEYLRIHPTERHELLELADRCGLSPTHFSRVFRRLTGISPGKYLIANRIAAAKSLLRDSDYPMKRIAEILGYRDPYFFSRQFRSETGIPPQRYRNQSGGDDGL